MPRNKFSKAPPLAQFTTDQVYGDYDAARQPAEPAPVAPLAPRSRERYTRGPFYLKIEGLTGPRPTSEEVNAARGKK